MAASPLVPPIRIARSGFPSHTKASIFQPVTNIYFGKSHPEAALLRLRPRMSSSGIVSCFEPSKLSSWGACCCNQLKIMNWETCWRFQTKLRAARAFSSIPSKSDKKNEDAMKYMRAVYGHEDWARHRSTSRYMRHILSIGSSRVIFSLRSPVFSLTLISVFTAAYNEAVVRLEFLSNSPMLHVDPLTHQLTAIALALLLVFRTNSSYARFDEARKAWGLVTNRSRDLTRQALSWIQHPEDADKLKLILHYIAAFSFCLKDHLVIEDVLQQELEGLLDSKEVKAILASPHCPMYILQILSGIIKSCHLVHCERSLMDMNLTQLYDHLGTCERIFKTPIPLSYTRLTSRMLIVWHATLPFALWDKLHWMTVPATFLCSAALLCIEEVGVLIEEPFSILALDNICKTIQGNVEYLTTAHQNIQDTLKHQRQQDTINNSS